MKLYIQDRRWRGCIVVIAENMNDAKTLMMQYNNYDTDSPIEEIEIISGFTYTNYGDM